MLKKIKQSAKDWVSNRRKRLSEDGSQKKITMCKKCYNFAYKNSWHFDKPLFLEVDRDEDVPVHFTECPACLEQEAAFYDRESEFAMG